MESQTKVTDWGQRREELKYIEFLVDFAHQKIKQEIIDKGGITHIKDALKIYLDTSLYKRREIGFYGFVIHFPLKGMTCGSYTIKHGLVEPYLSSDEDFNRLYCNLFFYMEGLNAISGS